jgi:hypothetical protein
MDADRQGEAERCTYESSQSKQGQTLDAPCNTNLGATVLH